MLPNLHVFGIQGSGKDTQASLIANEYGLTTLSSGALFRERMAMRDTVGTFIAQQIHAGNLLPDEFLFQVVENALRNLPIKQGIACSGIIRTVRQYETFEPLWKELGYDEPVGIFLEISDKVAEERALARKRSDDTPEALQKRFEAYHELTEPTIALMDKKDSLIRVNGDQPRDAVFKDILTALNKRLPDLHVTH